MRHRCSLLYVERAAWKRWLERFRFERAVRLPRCDLALNTDGGYSNKTGGDGAPGGEGQDGGVGNDGGHGDAGTDFAGVLSGTAEHLELASDNAQEQLPPLRAALRNGDVCLIRACGGSGGQGGDGGAGANGGAGGAGGAGAAGESVDAPARGGDGGNGGRGGRGGNGRHGGFGGRGGSGGNGARLIIATASPALLMLVECDVSGGKAGAGGRKGRGGAAGKGGRGGKGGAGGESRAIVRQEEKKRVTITGERGRDGQNGADGQDGKVIVSQSPRACVLSIAEFDLLARAGGRRRR